MTSFSFAMAVIDIFCLRIHYTILPIPYF